MSYYNELRTAKTVTVQHTSGNPPSILLFLSCMDCGATKPKTGFAPVYSENYMRGPYEGENLVLLCNACYDRRCLQF